MFCVKLLVVILSFTTLLQIQCQEDGEAVDVEYWECEPDYFEHDGYGTWFKSEGSCSYSFTPAPSLDFDLWPDFSCQPGFSKKSLSYTHRYCDGREPGSWGEEGIQPGYNWEQCYKTCMLDMLFVTDWMKTFRFMDSYHLNKHFGVEVGTQIMEKVQTACNSTLQLVVNEGKHSCDSPEVETLLKCVQDAVRC